MLLVRKSISSEAAFNVAIAGIGWYLDLKDDARKGAAAILWADQGHVCAICERHKDTAGGTIEHFLPKTHFGSAYVVDLQLNYWNLYMACTGCNVPKGDHLVPAYMFDPRFDPCSLANLFLEKEAIWPHYKQVDGKCKSAIPNPKVKGDSAFYSCMLLEATMELMKQNSERLQIQRAQAYATLEKLYDPKVHRLSFEDLAREWNRIRKVEIDRNSSYPEFVSLRLFFLRKALRDRGISRVTFESSISSNP